MKKNISTIIREAYENRCVFNDEIKEFARENYGLEDICNQHIYAVLGKESERDLENISFQQIKSLKNFARKRFGGDLKLLSKVCLAVGNV